MNRTPWWWHAFFALAIALVLASCATSNGDVHLKGDAAEAFRKLTGHEGVTISERTTIYGTENPPSERMRCHEEHHKQQAAVVADAMVKIGAIDDTELSRMLLWISLNAIENSQHGYKDSRYEQGARAACP